MNRKRFSEIVEREIRNIPAEFQPYLENLSFVVQDRVTPEQLDRWGLEPDEDDLLGFYDGIPVGERSSFEAEGPVLDAIYVFREPLLEMCATRRELEEEIRKTVVHEIAHHFGLDEDDVDRHGYA